jgi:hypothetical protein
MVDNKTVTFRKPGRVVGVRNAELIETSKQLNKVYGSMIHDASRWVHDADLKWKENGFVMKGDFVFVPKSAGAKTGDVVVSIGDYVINFNSGKRAIVYTPELKERVARGDFSWSMN